MLLHFPSARGASSCLGPVQVSILARIWHPGYMDDSFIGFILDQLDGLGEIRARRMFGGWGFYCDDNFFAIAHDERLYFKTNEATRQKYEKEGMKPFSPNEKQTLKNYYEIPLEVVENREIFYVWAEEAVNS